MKIAKQMPLHINPKLPNKYYHMQKEMKCIDMLIAGDGRQEVIEFLQEEYNIPSSYAAVEYWKIKNKLKSYTEEISKDDVIKLHVMRYEEIFKKLRKLKWNGLAMKVLRQKERLLAVDNEIAKQLRDKEEKKQIKLQEFEPDILSEGNKKELDELLLKVTTKK